MMIAQPLLTAEQVIALARLEWESKVEQRRQEEVVKARAYHEGDHPVYLTERLKEFLGLKSTDSSDKFRLNVSRQVVSAITERLTVIGLDTTEDYEDDSKPLAEWAWNVWQANRMDAKQDTVHDGIIRDGEYFIIVDLDPETRTPRFNLHQRYTDVNVGGDGDGCRMVYPENDPEQKPDYAVKRWTETTYDANGKKGSRQRMTLYFPNRVEKYFESGTGWEPFLEYELDEEGERQPKAWPIPWVDKQGKALGIPVIHGRNKGLGCEAWDAFPVQDAANKSFVDLIAAGDMSAFRIFVALGFIPTTDGKPLADDLSNALQVAPGQVVGTLKDKSLADFKAIDPADISGLIELVQQMVLWIAMVTDTPISRFQATKQVASRDTLKEQEEPLYARIEKRQTLIGNFWEDCMMMALRLQNAFGEEPVDIPKEGVMFTTLWKASRDKSTADLMTELKAKRDTLKVPLDQLWMEAGYTEEQIGNMKESDEYKALMAMLRVDLSVDTENQE